MKNINESGRSMVEMLGVLAIIGVLTAGVMSTVNYGIESFRVRAVYDLVEETARGVADLYSWKRSYRDDEDNPTTNASLMRSKICKNVLDNKCIEGTHATVKTAWGTLVVEPDNDDATQFKMQLTGVPYGSCNQLRNMEWVNVSLATTACNENSTTDLNFTAY